MSQKSRKNVLSQLFDVKPVKEDGSLHLEKIHSVRKCLNLKFIAKEKRKSPPIKLENNLAKLPDGRAAKEVFAPILTNYYQSPHKAHLPNIGEAQENRNIKVEMATASQDREMYRELSNDGVLNEIAYQQKAVAPKSDFVSDREKILSELETILSGRSLPGSEQPRARFASAKSLNQGNNSQTKKDDFWEVVGRYRLDNLQDQDGRIEENRGNKFLEKKDEAPIDNQEVIIPKTGNSLSKYAILASFVIVFVIGGYFVKSGLDSKDEALKHAAFAAEELLSAKDDLKKMDFKSASARFESAGKNFDKSKDSIGRFNYFFLSAASGLPLVSESKLSGINMIDAGEYLAKAGQMLSSDMLAFSRLNFKDVFQPNGKSELLEALKDLDVDLDDALTYMILARKNVEKVDESSLPDNISKKELIEKIEEAKMNVVDGQKYVSLVLDLIGAQRSKEYLLLFQNPSEMRATGGFIGSYGIVKMEGGKIKKIFVNDIFNPDGQLTEKVVPPFPIQKISTAWSMHDSNWFFDFPTSAQKVAWFYEKAGGSTVDAVIALNPFVIEKLLDITGPIDMPEYDTVIVSENFIDAIQSEVEEGDNKKENKPKKILADLMPKLLEKLFSQKERIPQIIEVLKNSIEEKDIMAYSFSDKMQSIISEKGFSGEILNSKNDYLAVVSSNINGYKTDKMIDSSVDLKSEIDNDGYVVNTVTITKTHNGGSSQYDFYNMVNADYLRVYVPEGAMLIDASGHTIEKNKAPIDYDKAEFKKDSDVMAAESTMMIDEKTKTNIYKESGKTVFANWVFVSPKKEVVVTYKYRLPKRFDFSGDYQVIFQKQSGSKMKLNWKIDFPAGSKIYSDDTEVAVDRSSASLSSGFKNDKTMILNIKR